MLVLGIPKAREAVRAIETPPKGEDVAYGYAADEGEWGGREGGENVVEQMI